MVKRFSKSRQAMSLLLLLSSAQLLLAQETIIAFRHGEKPSGGLGQLSCTGLNRAMALPGILTQRFGKPNVLYAPSPAVRIIDGLHLYSYARPLATIEPTAISFGMPVNTQIGWNDIKKLRTELTAGKNKSAVIFVAWEHTKLNELAEQLRSYGKASFDIPKWPDDDYDRLYIFKLNENHGKPELTFEVDHEGLNGSLKESCQ